MSNFVNHKAGEERLAQGEERRLQAEESSAAPRRKYVKKSAKWHTKPIQRKLDFNNSPEITTAVAADAGMKRNEGAQKRRWAVGKKKNSDWKRLKSGWVNMESKPKAYRPLVSYFKIERTQFDPEQFFSEIEQEILADADNPAVEKKARA